MHKKAIVFVFPLAVSKKLWILPALFKSCLNPLDPSAKMQPNIRLGPNAMARY